MKTRVVISILGVAAVGAVVGMLLAPESGKDLRKKLSHKAGDLADNLADLIDTGKEQLEDLKSTAKKAARKMEDHVSRRVEENV